MAWNISKAKRQALVKLQLRDKDGRFIEMGGGVKWYSSRLKKVVAGTVVGSKGENALVRLNKENPTHEPALVSVPANAIKVVDSKASLPAKGEGAPSADQTPEFEKPGAVADVEADPNAEEGSDHESQLKGPQHLASNYGVTETSDGNTYITRKDGESVYSPARALKVGDELISPAGADPTKPFSIGRGWATKGTERLNKEGEGPVIGKVIAISENRYAVVQMAGGHTIPDRRNPEEMTDTVTVGLSNQVILATMGLKDALGDRVSSQQYAERPDTEEKEVDATAPEAQSDHEGREVPEDQLEGEPAEEPVDRTEQQLEIARSLPVGGFVVADDGSQKFTKTATNQWRFSGGTQLIDDASMVRMVQRGEGEGKSYKAGTDADPVDAPESAPDAPEAPETQPTPESPVEEATEAPEEVPEAPEAAPKNDIEEIPEDEPLSEPEEAPETQKPSAVNDIVDGLAELEQAAEDVEGSGLEDEESEEVLNGASFDVTAADGSRQTVTAEKDENGDWAFVVADENGAEVSSHVIGSEENRVIAEKIANGSAAAPKKDEAPDAEVTPEAAPEVTPEAPESYNENGLTESEQREVDGAMRLASRSYEQFKDDAGDRYKAIADAILAKGAARNTEPSAEAPNEEAPASQGAPTISDADKIANAEKMYGTGSKQHKEAQERWGQKDEAPVPAEKPETAPIRAPEPEKAPEVTPEPAKPVEDAPAPSLVEPDAATEGPSADEILAEHARRVEVLDSMPVGSEIVSDDGEQQRFVKAQGGKWAYASARNQLIDSKSVVGMVERGEASGTKYKGRTPLDAPEEPAKPLLNGEEGFVPIDGRGQKGKQDATPTEAPPAKPAPFGITFERQSDGLDHAVVSRPEVLTPEEAEDFRKLDIDLTWAQHENRSGREAIARGKLNDLNRRVQSRLDSESVSRKSGDDGSAEDTAPAQTTEEDHPTPLPDEQIGEIRERLNAPEVAPEAAPEPEATPETAPDAPAAPVVDPNVNEDGLLPDEATRLADLENRLAAAYRGESSEDATDLDNEIVELIHHGRLRGRGREVGPFRASRPVPDAAPDAAPEPEAPAAPEVPEVSPEAPEATPETSDAPRTRNSADTPVADADGNMISRGDKIGHPTLGPVEVTKTIPASGRVEFIDPTTGRKKSVKAARVRKIDPDAAEAPAEEESATVEPGSRFVDRATGKQGFGDSNGNRVLVGDRIRHSNGNTGTVKAVYTAGSGGAWPAVEWDNDGKVRRAMGNVLEKDDSTAPEATPEAAPEATPKPIEVVRPSATPTPAPERVEPAEEPFEPVIPSATPAPAPAPEAPEAETFETASARRQALIHSTPINSAIISDDGTQKFYKISDTQWQFNEGNLLTPVAVANFMALGENRGMKFAIGEGRPAEVNNTPVVDIPAPATPESASPSDPNANTPGRRAQLLNRLRSLPAGTKLESSEHTFTKEGDDRWSSSVDQSSVLSDEDISGLLLTGRARGLTYQSTIPGQAPTQQAAPTVLPTVTLDPIPLLPDSLVPPTVASRHEAFKNAPIGTTVTSPAGTTVYTKQADDEWTSPEIPGAVIKNSTLAIATDSDNGYWVFNKTGPAEPEGINITAIPATEKLRAFRQAPIGSKLVSTGGKVITKMADRLWTTDTGTDYQPADLVFVTDRRQTDISGPFGLVLPETAPGTAPNPEAPFAGGQMSRNTTELERQVNELPDGSTITGGRNNSTFVRRESDVWSPADHPEEYYNDSDLAWRLGLAYDINAPVAALPDTGPAEVDRPRIPMPDTPLQRLEFIRDSINGSRIYHEGTGQTLEKTGTDQWKDLATGDQLNTAQVYLAAQGIDGWYANEPPTPEAPARPAIHAQLPKSSFVPSAAGSKSGVKKVGDDKWEMIKDGQPTGRFVNDEAVSVIQELVGTEVYNPRFGNNVGMYAEDLKLPGGKSLGEYLESGGSYGRLTEVQKSAIRAGYQRFVDNLNTTLPDGFRAELQSLTFGSNSMATSVEFYDKNGRAVNPASRNFGLHTDDRTGKRVSSVDHAYWHLADDAQGSGLSSAFLQASKQMYRQMGLDRITVHADISVGSYAWARGGFDFVSRSHLSRAMGEWEGAWGRAPRGREQEWIDGIAEFNRLKALATQSAFMNKTHPPAVLFANIGRPTDPSKTGPNDTWFGKAMISNTHWWGAFMLNPNG